MQLIDKQKVAIATGLPIASCVCLIIYDISSLWIILAAKVVLGKTDIVTALLGNKNPQKNPAATSHSHNALQM